MLAELLAVVRGDDDHGIFQQASFLKFIKEPIQLIVEVRDGSIVHVQLGFDFSRRPLEPILAQAATQVLSKKMVAARQIRTESFGKRARREIGLMGIEIVEKGKEGPVIRAREPC